MTQGRDKEGKFASKSETSRKVRSIRLTDSTWELLGKLSEERGITRADLLEEWVSKGFFSGDIKGEEKPNLDELEKQALKKFLFLAKVGSQSKSAKAAKKILEWLFSSL